jgi:hypothetical protein
MRTAPLLIALGVATMAHADDRTLHLAVHGSIDGATVAAALANELAVQVELVDGTCALPCLDVAVDGKQAATIVFAPRQGEPRQRTVQLGNDTGQWPLMITLLAGNVVRDEAQDVLAGLPSGDLPGPAAQEVADLPPPPPVVEEPPPPPVAPPVIAAAPAAPERGEHRWLGIGLVPGLSTDLTHVGSVRHFLSLDLLVGVSGGSSGLTVSGVADIERGLVAGVQVGGVASIARRVAGTQVAGVAAVSGDVDGVQVAGAAAVADLVEGFQVAGVATVAHGGADHQAAGVAAVARGGSSIQLAGVAAVTGRDAGLQAAGVASFAGDAGVQLAGVASVARRSAGVQIAGVVNVARRLTGVQIAPVNVAREGAGTQIGVINVGGDPDGFSFGLINIVPGGRYDVEAAIDSSKIGTALFRHGGRRWHNVYGVGGHVIDEDEVHKADPRRPNDDVWMYGLGFGPSLAFGDTVIDLEAIGWQVNHGPRHETDVSILGQLRLSVAHHWGPFAVVAGGILNTYVTDDQSSPLMLERRTSPIDPMDRGTHVTIWPSAFVGVRI